MTQDAYTGMAVNVGTTRIDVAPPQRGPCGTVPVVGLPNDISKKDGKPLYTLYPCLTESLSLTRLGGIGLFWDSF